MTYSLRTTRSIIKKYYTGEISDEAVIYIRNQLTEITKTIATIGVNAFIEKNKLRQNLGLKAKKRLGKTCFKNITDNILKEITDKNLGEVEKLFCQDGAKR